MKDKKLVIVLILIIVFLLVGGAYYLGTRNSNISQQQNQVSVTNKEESTCTADSTPSLKILSPKQGDLYFTGQKVSIKWTSCNVKNIYLSSGSGGKNFGLITSNPISASSGSYLWTVSNPAKQFTSLDTNTYFVNIESKSPNISTRSGEFMVKSISDVNTEDSTSEVFKNQPGAIKSVKSQGVNSWVLVVDLLSHNPKWLPGVDGTGGFFINQNTKIRQLTIDDLTVVKGCRFQQTTNGPASPVYDYGVKVFAEMVVSEISNAGKDGREFGYTAYFDINGTHIDTIYQQCLP